MVARKQNLESELIVQMEKVDKYRYIKNGGNKKTKQYMFVHTIVLSRDVNSQKEP